MQRIIELDRDAPPPASEPRAVGAAAVEDEHEDADETDGRNFGSVRPWAGNMMPPSHFDPNTCDHSQPAFELVMDHVYGYRARAARDNVHWIDEPTTFIYIAAAVAVVYNWVERVQRTFKGHEDDVSCVTYSRSTRLAASGGLGKRNTAPIFVWSVDTMKTVHCLKGTLEFDIVSIAFNVDGSRLAAIGGDPHCSLALYDVRSGAMLTTSRGDSNRILHVISNTTEGTDSRKAWVSIGISHVKFWNKDKGNLVGKKAIGGDIAKQTMVSVVCTNDFVLAGTVVGKAYVFSGGTLIKTVKLHADFCGALACENNVLFSGGRDGFVRRWAIAESGEVTEEHATEINSRNTLSAKSASSTRKLNNGARAMSVMNGKIVFGTNLGSLYVAPSDFEVHTVLDAHFEDKPGTMPELWGMAIHPTDPVFATASEDATLRLWSIELGSMILCADVHYPAVSCGFSHDGSHIAVGHTNGAFSVWDATTLSPVVPFTRKRDFVCQCCSFSPDGRFLALGMGLSHKIDVYDAMRGFKYVASCDALSGNVKQLDWSASSLMLRCSTASYEVVHFNIPSCEMNQSLDVADEAWHSQTCIIGWGVQGIWEGCSDGTDVNCVARSSCGTLLAVGYDSCDVRLYNFPCLPRVVENQARMQFPRNREYRGHGSHVTNCGFSADNRYLLTSGGMDLTVIRWRVVPLEAKAQAVREAERMPEEDEDEEAGGAEDVAAAVDAGKIRDLGDDATDNAKGRLSQSMRMSKQFGASGSVRTTQRRPGSSVKSRLFDTTASQVEKARIGRAQRENVERQTNQRNRFAL
jgi:microtubule-associated protein-like 6